MGGKEMGTTGVSGTSQDSGVDVRVDEHGRRQVRLVVCSMMMVLYVHSSIHGLVLQAICGYTWPGIEYGEPPTPAYTFFEVCA